MNRGDDELAIPRLRSAAAQAADPGYDDLRARAVAAIQAVISPASGWTDFNLHDPGVTLLEAAVWAAADLAYRSDLDGHWRDRVALSRSTALPPGPVDDPLADDRRQRFALDRFGHLEGVGTGAPPVPDGGDPVVAAIAPHWRAFAGDLVAADGDPALLAAVANRVRRRLISTVLNDELPRVRQSAAQVPVGDFLDGIRDLLATRLGWLPDLDELLAELADVPEVPLTAELCEDAAGCSRIWPPHRAQLLGGEPVTTGDYVSRVRERLPAALAAAGLPPVGRVWVVPGLAAGLRSDGRMHDEARPTAADGLTILLDAPTADPRQLQRQAQASTSGEALLRVCAGLFLTAAELGGRRYHDGTAADDDDAHRLLGDALCFAAVGRQRLRITGRILSGPERSAWTMRETVTRALLDRLDAGPAIGGGAVQAGGWPPGRAVELGELTRHLRDIPGVEQVSDLVLYDADGTPFRQRLTLPAFTVPVLTAADIDIAVESLGAAP